MSAKYQICHAVAAQADAGNSSISSYVGQFRVYSQLALHDQAQQAEPCTSAV